MKSWINVGGMLDESLYRLYVSSNIFIQHAIPFILSFNVKSRMATDTLFPVILLELVDSDDGKPCRGMRREWISFLNLSFIGKKSVLKYLFK